MFPMRSLTNVAVVVFLAGLTIFGQTTAKRVHPETPDMLEIRNYRLSMDKVDKFAVASNSLMTLAKAHPELRSVMDNESGTKTIDDSVARMESKFPQAATAVQKSGLTVREYLLTSISLMTTTMAAGMKKQGHLKEVPAGVSAENLAFVEQNWDKLEKVMRSLSQMDTQ